MENTQSLILKGISIIFFFGFVNGFYKDPLIETSLFLFWIQDAFGFVVLPIIVLSILYKRINLKPYDYGFIKPSLMHPLSELIGATIFTAVVLGIVYFVVNVLSHFFLNQYNFLSNEYSYVSVVPEGLLKIPVVLYLSITAAVVEEIFYRALPYKLIMKNEMMKYKKYGYVIFTSIFFALIHWESGLHELVSTFAFGVVAALFYLTYKNIWPLIGGHFLVDVYAFL